MSCTVTPTRSGLLACVAFCRFRPDSSATGVRTSRRGSTTTTSSLTSAGTRLCHGCGAPSPVGEAVITGGETDGRWLGGFDRQIRAKLLSPFVGQTLTTFISAENYEDMIELKNFIEAGTVRPVIDRTFPLSEVPEAIRYLRDGRARGKVRHNRLRRDSPCPRRRLTMSRVGGTAPLRAERQSLRSRLSRG